MRIYTPIMEMLYMHHVYVVHKIVKGICSSKILGGSAVYRRAIGDTIEVH